MEEGMECEKNKGGVSDEQTVENSYGNDNTSSEKECNLDCPPCGKGDCATPIHIIAPLGAKTLSFVHLKNDAEIIDPFNLPIRRNDRYVLLIMSWMDLYADSHDCRNYCTNSGIMYHLVDIETDTSKLVAKIDSGLYTFIGREQLPPEDYSVPEEIYFPSRGKYYKLDRYGLDREIGRIDYRNSPPKYINEYLQVCKIDEDVCNYIPIPLTFLANPD
jgi:hypothetical protein